jgi:hypothetical protein
MGLLSGNRQLQLGTRDVSRRSDVRSLRADALRPSVAEETALASEIPRDPELSPRQQVIMLLQTAAEIEHALLVQYLFAGYSLRLDVPIPNAGEGRTTSEWQAEVLGIAKEEMGHLLCIQNCLRAIGGPNYFGRDNFPMHTGVYPFPFRLEPMSLTSIARYVAAEMPEPSTIPGTTLSEEQLRRIASLTGGHVNRVGVLFALLHRAIELLPDDAIRLDRDAWQEFDGWGAEESFDPPLSGIRVFTIRGGSAGERKSRLQRIVAFIGEQGESPTIPETVDSHFERFARIFRELDGAGRFDPALPLVDNPNTTSDPQAGDILSPAEVLREQELAPGRIRDDITRLWAKLFNVRYRVLLTALAHSCASGPLVHPQTSEFARDVLRQWAFEEMFTIPDLANMLSARPVGGVSTKHAGPCFELPYSVQLGDRGPERWSTYLDLFDATKTIADALRAGPLSDPEKELLNQLLTRDGGNSGEGRRETVTTWLTVDAV